MRSRRDPRHEQDYRGPSLAYEPRRTFRRDEDMGGSAWSGASGRGGMHDPTPELRGYGYGRGGGQGYRYVPPYERPAYERPREHDLSDDDLGFGYVGHEGREDRGPHYGKGPKGYRRSDARVLEDVCDAIAQQGFIDASDVEVKVAEGVITLSGTVGQRHDKRALEQLVEHLHGVVDVQNELRLSRPPSVDRTPVSRRPADGDHGRKAHHHPNGKVVR